MFKFFYFEMGRFDVSWCRSYLIVKKWHNSETDMSKMTIIVTFYECNVNTILVVLNTKILYFYFWIRKSQKKYNLIKNVNYSKIHNNGKEFYTWIFKLAKKNLSIKKPNPKSLIVMCSFGKKFRILNHKCC